MISRRFAWPMLFAVVFLCLVVPPAGEALAQAVQTPAQAQSLAQADRPNIVFILTDDQQADTIAALNTTLGQEPGVVNVRTPNIDSLVERGVVFNRAYHQGAWSGAVCLPSRTMIMTGRTVWHISRPWDEQKPPPFIDQCLAATFNDAGYDTFRVCKRGNSFAEANAMFDINIEERSRGADGPKLITDHVIEYLDARQAAADTDPFLIYYAFTHPHDPRDAPQQYLDQYHANVPDPDPDADINLLPPLPRNYMTAHPFDNGAMNIRDETSVRGVMTNRDDRTIRNELGKYYATIENLDAEIGRVLNRLEDPNQDGDTSDSIMDNTYVIFTSDHGLAMGRHGLMGKQNLYEHSWRVPMIVTGPSIEPGETEAFIYLLDLMPTFCDFASIDIPDAVEGHSFAGNCTDLEAPGRDMVIGVYTEVQRSIRVGDWKLIWYTKIDRVQLFNLIDDPLELSDLSRVQEHAPKVARLRAALLQRMTELDDPLTKE